MDEVTRARFSSRACTHDEEGGSREGCGTSLACIQGEQSNDEPEVCKIELAARRAAKNSSKKKKKRGEFLSATALE